MKKESLQITTVKTLLAVLLFAGIGTIIIGGGYIIGECNKNKINNQVTKPVNQENEDYYDLLKKECPLSSCYLSSLRYMKENDYKKREKLRQCPEGFESKRLECRDSLSWCRPMITRNDVLPNTNKTKYQIGEKIGLTIENKLNRDIKLFIVSLEKYDNKNWKRKISNILCNNPDNSCRQEIISPNSIGKYCWSQKNFGWSDLDGIYRFRVVMDREDVYMPTSVFSNKFAVGDQNDISDLFPDSEIPTKTSNVFDVRIKNLSVETTDSSAKLKWETEGSENSPFSFPCFHIEWNELPRYNIRDGLQVEASVNSYTVENLKPNQEYNFLVAACKSWDGRERGSVHWHSSGKMEKSATTNEVLN